MTPFLHTNQFYKYKDLFNAGILMFDLMFGEEIILQNKVSNYSNLITFLRHSLIKSHGRGLLNPFLICCL